MIGCASLPRVLIYSVISCIYLRRVLICSGIGCASLPRVLICSVIGCTYLPRVLICSVIGCAQGHDLHDDQCVDALNSLMVTGFCPHILSNEELDGLLAVLMPSFSFIHRLATQL